MMLFKMELVKYFVLVSSVCYFFIARGAIIDITNISDSFPCPSDSGRICYRVSWRVGSQSGPYIHQGNFALGSFEWIDNGDLWWAFGEVAPPYVYTLSNYSSLDELASKIIEVDGESGVAIDKMNLNNDCKGYVCLQPITYSSVTDYQYNNAVPIPGTNCIPVPPPQNSCKFDVATITLDHGNVPVALVNGHSKDGYLTVTCTQPSSVSIYGMHHFCIRMKVMRLKAVFI